MFKIAKTISVKKKTASEKFNLCELLNIKRKSLCNIMKKTWEIFKFGVLVYVGVYIGLSSFFYVFQPNILFQPNPRIETTPQDIGLKYEDISFNTSDEITLKGWYVPANSSRGVVLLCHGNAGNIGNRLEILNLLHRLRLSTFIFDYRGYGQSEGVISEKGTYLDAEAAWNYLTEQRNISQKEIVIFGRSLGGAIAADLAKDKTPKVLIIDSTFTSFQELAADKSYEIFFPIPVALLSRFEYNTIEDIKRASCPVLIVHSKDDETIPYSHGCKLFKWANEPKEFLKISGTHNEGFLTSKGYEVGLAAFIDQYL